MHYLVFENSCWKMINANTETNMTSLTKLFKHLPPLLPCSFNTGFIHWLSATGLQTDFVPLPLHLFSFVTTKLPFRENLLLKGREVVICVRRDTAQRVCCCHRDPCPSKLLMRLVPFKVEWSCQCSCSLCVTVVGCPLLGHRGSRAEGVEQLPGSVTLVCRDEGALPKAAGDAGIVSCSSEVALGWHRGFPPGCPNTSFLPERRAYAITVPAGGPATAIQAQRMYKKIQARAAGKLHTDSSLKEMIFSLKTVCSLCFCNEKNRTEIGNIFLRKGGKKHGCIYLCMKLIANWGRQQHTPQYPSHWDNLNDNVICHFVHKLIYSLSQTEVWWRRLLGALMSLQNWVDETSHFSVPSYTATNRRRLKSFLSRASIRLKGKQ